MIALTEQQRQALEAQKEPLRLVSPRTQEIYVLIRQDVYDLTRSIGGGGQGEVWDDEADNDLIRKRAGIGVTASK